MKTASQLLREAEGLKSRLSNCSPLVGNNEVWAVQHQLQVVCGQLLVHWIEAALDRGVERDLWNLGFRNTITQLQAQAKDKQQGGSSEARDLLSWFLNSASGFYLQLFNQICTEYGLDLPFRRKDSIYGAVEVNGSIPSPSKSSSQKNALYLCQYCLVHLGDLARYRHQAKQAETYYRHAVQVAPTSGHPYNQLALLEAGRGNRLAAVALYVRAMCVPCPFPGAPANLTQTLTKVLASSGPEVGGWPRVTGEEYTSLFLQCHARLYLHSDTTTARHALPTLASALSTLVATNAFTRTSLIQMVVVNLFALSYFSGDVKIKISDEVGGNKKDEEKVEKPKEPKECEDCLRVVEEVTVGMLAALLLPVHTIRDPDQLVTYPGLPAVRLVFEWVRCESSMLTCEAMKKKQQIWPGLCTLVNNLQHHLGSFNANKYSEVPLAEDWDLQGFEPLQKMLNKFKYREGLCKPSPEEYNCIRASRLTDVAKWCTQQCIDGNSVIKVRDGDNGSGLVFEPMQHSSPPVEEVRALQQLSLHPNNEEKPTSRRGKVGILKPQGSLERARETREHQDPAEQNNMEKAARTDTTREQGGNDMVRIVTVQPASVILNNAIVGGGQRQQGGGGGGGSGSGGLAPQISSSAEVVVQQPRPPRTRTNVALQAIMKRNSAMQEAKQVTFKTPSPAISPNPSEASSDSHRSQLSTPPLQPPPPLGQRDPVSSSPMPYHQLYQMAAHTQGSGGGGFSRPTQQGNNDNAFSNQQFGGGQTAWGGIGVNSSSPHTLNLPFHQPNPLMNSGSSLHQSNQHLNSGSSFSAQRNNAVRSPPNVLKATSSGPNPADLLTAGMFNRPPPEGFHQLNRPSRPGVDMPSRPGVDMPPRSGVDTPLRPGLDMPPRPGLDMPPRPGLDMPPRPGLDMPPRPGLDMPPRPGLDMPPRPGLDMPPRPGLDMPPRLGMDMPPRLERDMPPRPGLDMPPRQNVDMPLRPNLDMPPRSNLDMPPRLGLDMSHRSGLDMPLRPGLDMPPRPGLDMPSRPGMDTRLQEPAPRILEMMGMARAPPSFGPVEGLNNPVRVRPPGSDGGGGGMDLNSRNSMTQVPYRPPQSHQDINSSPSQNKLNSVFPSGAINPHQFGMEGRQNVGCSNAPMLRNMFGEGSLGEPRSPGFVPSLNLAWGSSQGDNKSYPISHPPTLASLLQQHAPVDMRLNLSLDNGSEQHNSGMSRISSGPPSMGPRSPPGVGPMGGVHLGLLTRPPTQMTGPRPQTHMPPPPHSPFLHEGGDGDGSSSSTYSLFSPMSGGSNLGVGTGPSRTVPHPLYPANSQPTGQQSLWSGPGPSPLERLLEQKKYNSVPK